MSSPLAPIRLGHLVPERRPVVISRTNPLWANLPDDDPQKATMPELVDVILQAYVFGDRCPGIVKAELANLHATYLEEAATYAGGLGDGERLREARFKVAWHTFIREAIEVLIPGLTSGEADLLAANEPGEEGPGATLLRSLGLWRRQDQDDPDPEAVGEASQPTMALSSPTSPVSTGSPPPNS